MSQQVLAKLLTGRGVACDENAWDELVPRAIREHVAPMLFHRLANDESVPSAARESLRGELYNTGAFNLVLFRALSQVLESAPGTPVVLKGAALATTVYEDPALRPMCDVDLLVDGADLGAWVEHLTELGYERASPEMATGLTETAHYHMAFRSSGDVDDIVIELHWSLVAGNADWRAPDLSWVWKQTEPWRGPEEPACPDALQLAPTALVSYLCAHAFLQHGRAGARLVWLHDIHRVIEQRGDDVSWHELTDKARAFEWDAAVADALEQCAALFGTAVPVDALSELRRDADTRTARHVRSKADKKSSRAELVWRELLCLDAAARAHLVLAILFPRPAYLKWRYPRARWLWPLAYAYRWGIVAWEAAAAVLRQALSGYRPSTG